MMTYSPKVLEIIGNLKSFLTAESTKLKFRVSEQDFSRDSGKLGFEEYALLGISLLKNSTASEVFNTLTSNDLPYVSKSAYTQGRYKIEAKFYQSWTTMLVDSSYKLGLASKMWKGYFLEAIDGTSMTLPQTQALSKAFGTHKNGTKKGITETVMAKCLLRADVLNGYVLDSEVFKTTQSEVSICKTWLWRLNSNSVTLFDRGFANAAIFAYLGQHNKPFVCRLKVGFNKVVKAFMASDLTDTEVYFEIGKTETFANQVVSEDKTATCSVPDTCIKKGDKVKVRLVKVVLPTGEVEVLATNLRDKTVISVVDLGDLYRQRWGIETIIDSLKNQLLWTVFSGEKPAAILQETYATMFVHNLRQLLTNEGQELVNEQVMKSERCIHTQKVNMNTALGVLKPKIIPLFLAEEPQKIVEELLLFFVKNKISKVSDKPMPKREKSLAKRRNLVIQGNYKKAV
jgi:hypothetical protein